MGPDDSVGSHSPHDDLKIKAASSLGKWKGFFVCLIILS